MAVEFEERVSYTENVDQLAVLRKSRGYVEACSDGTDALRRCRLREKPRCSSRSIHCVLKQAVRIIVTTYSSCMAALPN
jgi:hypothetical protein